MSYQVLARKYRPQTFDEVVGQEAVVATLKNAITSKRLHHAYLFSGARGIGKTSLARIFAKALNCEKGPTATPCNQCTFCKEITEGASLDVHEIDGASNTSVDDVRELREGLKYLPAAARNKIYIIDEVHMLSGSAFNALLKTLEEPPPHVVFLFATTESQKIPATILSRCQRFDLRRLSTDQVLAQLKKVCEQEKIAPNPDALLMIAREAEGSLRDSQSLLDQAIAYSSGKLSAELISSMLGLVNTTAVHAVTEAVLQCETAKALEVAQEVFEKGHDLKQFVTQWLTHWRNLYAFQTTRSEKVLEGLTENEKAVVKKQAEAASGSVLDLGFHFLSRGVEEISRSEFPKIVLDVLMIRLANAGEFSAVSSLLEELKGGGIPEAGGRMRGEDSGVRKQKAEAPSKNSASSEVKGRLKEFLQHVSSKRPQVGSLLSHVKAVSQLEDVIYFQLDPGGIWLEMLSERKGPLEEMASAFYARPMRVVIQETSIPAGGESFKNEQDEAGSSSVDPIVHSALNILGAKIEEVKR